MKSSTMDDVNTTLLGKPKQQSRLTQVLKQRDFWVIWIVPFAVYVFLDIFYVVGFMALPTICILTSVFFMIVAAGLFVVRNTSVRFLLPISMLIPLSVVAGTILGLYTYDVYGCFPMFYQNARIYTEVVPSQSSAAVADAGKLIFDQASYVDRQKGVGYITERGNLFCVAPIRDASPPAEVEFWAVGIGCCSPQGDFWCDASKDQKAKGGVVVFDNNGMFASSRFDEYDKARRKAQSIYGLLSTSQPTYVRWVTTKDLNLLANEYRMKAILCCTVSIVLYGLCLAVITYAIYKPKTARDSSAVLS
eukprot:TRINITY_DN79941_c0_g1_i1.p1 TRINITY_DN79941_c0_g1~~TRINITY_DN79941_c0_g1_i1.p1  ORF type:complete len:305 (+),score=41.54 TRINITY_DN79941_c0_g1_i1:94-1008(+)